MSVVLQELVPLSALGVVTSSELKHPNLKRLQVSVRDDIARPVLRSPSKAMIQVLHSKIKEFRGTLNAISKIASSELTPLELMERGSSSLKRYEQMIRSGYWNQKQKRLGLSMTEIFDDYQSVITNLITNRKTALERALDEIDREEFLDALFGAIMAYCLVLSMLIDKKRFYDEQTLDILLLEGGRLGGILAGYTDTLDIMTNPSERKLIEDAEREKDRV